MKKIIRIIIFLILGLVVVFAALIGYLRITEWMPQNVEISYEAPSPVVVNIPDTITVVSWNIGYAGLGDDMDFFYDGGKSMRTSKERTEQNLASIIDFLKENQADFILIQEIDFDSKRSYNMDQYKAISSALSDYKSAYAYNYVSKFVPMPLSEPMGKICSGMATFSKYPMTKSVRYQYPSAFSFPMRLFNLKRALLVTEYKLPDGSVLYVNNTHNTAFDTGDMRVKEINFLSEFLATKPYSITAGDWNCNPPSYKASRKELEDPNFSPISVKTTDFPGDMTFAADVVNPSARYGYEPYKAGSTTTTVLDFGLLGSKFEVVSVETVNLGFKNSDHNPLVMKIALK